MLNVLPAPTRSRRAIVAAITLCASIFGGLWMVAVAPAASAACTSIPPDRDINVTTTVYRTAHDRQVPSKVLLATFEAGWVESHMNNLSCGDKDSLGVFQQRASWGTTEQRLNVAWATNAFLDLAIPANVAHPEYTAGQLAQAVQRSAFPDRYDAAEGKANALISEAQTLIGSPAPLSGAIEVTVRGSRYDVFERTSTNDLLQWTYLNGSWHGPTDLHAKILSAPSVTVDENGRYDVFALGTDNTIIHSIFADGQWSRWEHLSGKLIYGVSVVRPAPGRFDIFSVDTNHRLRQKIYNGGVWSDWTDNFGGYLTSAPNVVYANGRYDVFATDTDHHLVQRVYNGAAWSTSWNDLGGNLTSAPSVTRRGDRYDVYSTDTSHRVIYSSYAGTTWTPWRSLPGTVSSAPAVVNPGPSRYDVFTADVRHRLVQNTYDGRWHIWHTLPGVTVPVAG